MTPALETLAYWLIEFGDWLDNSWLTPLFVRAGVAVYRIVDGRA